MAKQARGICSYCGAEVVKQSIEKHLAKCAPRQSAITTATGKSEPLIHLRAEWIQGKSFFLDLEVRGSATLQDLDHYLRAIWLECCGHLSEFNYTAWDDSNIPLTKKLSAAFKEGSSLVHLYDMGDTSETLLRTISVRTGAPTTPHPMVLLVRNKLPESKCELCGGEATLYCVECQTEGEWVTLCEDCWDEHGHTEDYAPGELVNSPRLGMCGYDGPATPPY